MKTKTAEMQMAEALGFKTDPGIDAAFAGLAMDELTKIIEQEGGFGGTFKKEAAKKKDKITPEARAKSYGNLGALVGLASKPKSTNYRELVGKAAIGYGAGRAAHRFIHGPLKDGKEKKAYGGPWGSEVTDLIRMKTDYGYVGSDDPPVRKDIRKELDEAIKHALIKRKAHVDEEIDNTIRRNKKMDKKMEEKSDAPSTLQKAAGLMPTVLQRTVGTVMRGATQPLGMRAGMGAVGGAALGAGMGAMQTPQQGQSRFGGAIRGALGGSIVGAGMGAAAKPAAMAVGSMPNQAGRFARGAMMQQVAAGAPGGGASFQAGKQMGTQAKALGAKKAAKKPAKPAAKKNE